MNPGGRAALGSLLLAVAVVACGSSGGGTADAAGAVDAIDAADAAGAVDAIDAADAALVCNCGMVGMMAQAGSCTFSIPCPPGDFGRLFVFEDGTTIPQDTTHQNGWDFTDATSTHVQIYGEACAAITSGTVTTTSWGYGCGSSP